MSDEVQPTSTQEETQSAPITAGEDEARRRAEAYAEAIIRYENDIPRPEPRRTNP